MTEKLTLGVIVGSTRRGRFGSTVASWFVDATKTRDDVTIDVIDLTEVALPTVLPDFGETDPPAVRNLSPRLDAADAFVVVTPEYNHSIPASLKNAIDWYGYEWRAKPVGFVSYGGVAGGLRAVEHLRQVFAELHGVAVRDGVSFPNYWDAFDKEGHLVDSQGATMAAKVMLDQLIWWGVALRNHRRVEPYAA